MMSDRARLSFVVRWIAVAAVFVSAGRTALYAQQPPGAGEAHSPPISAPAPQSAPQPALQPAPPATVPVALGPSGQITKWFSLRGEFRLRLEGFSNGGFKPDNSDGYLLDRFRFNLAVTASPAVTFVAQLQDARTFDKATGGMGNPFRDRLDLRLAYSDLGRPRARVRVGRQELVFGEQRLLGHLGWANNARSFDGVRATLALTPFAFDVFATSLVTIRPEAFDKSGYGNRLYGFYGSTGQVTPKATVEPYFFWRQSTGLTLETGGLGDIHQATVGTRVAGKLPRSVDYGFELVRQAGTVSTDRVQAWAGHWVGGKTFTKTPGGLRAFGEFNYASGDRNPKDGIRGTFDQLYPTFHDKIGLADQSAWKNIEHVRGGVELKPKVQWQLSGSYHALWLASPTDALYAANGTPVARSTSWTAGRFVGQEIDAQAAYTYSSQLQLAGGYSHLLPGAFLSNTTPSAAYSWGYLMVTYVFLGDRPVAAREGSR